ncbi:MAG: hypothetical protein II835_10245 [Fibrobacter sp.]|nr:hypothetical protein [Fibrobacter sp.]
MKKFVLLLLGVATLLSAETFTVHFLIPNDSCWIESGVGLVINNDGNLQAMQKDEEYPGWYSYSWDKANLPTSVLFYCKEDKALEHPIGFSKIGADTLMAFDVKLLADFFDFGNAQINALYYVPDEEYYGDYLWGESGNLTDEDLRPHCYYTKKTVIPDPPYEYPFKATEVYYSILNTSGDTIQTEKQMTCDENEIVRFCGGNITIQTTMFPEGEYKLAARISINGEEFDHTIKFVSKSDNETLDLKGPSKSVSQIKIHSSGLQIQIFSSEPNVFSVFNSKGQTIQKGRVNGSTNIAIMAPGTYWVKVGSETRRVQVFN